MIRLPFLPRIIAGAAVFCAASLRAAVPVFPAHPNSTDVPTTMPVGKTLVVPLACDDADDQTLSYTVTSTNPHVFARVKTGNPQVKMTVHADDNGSGSAIDGVMEFQLFRDFTPSVASFIAGYAQSGYYENIKFHRVIPDFVVQGGDPAGTGSGVDNHGTPNDTTDDIDYNLNYNLPHEFRNELIFSGRGQLAMANSFGGYTFDSSFFFVPVATSFPSNGNTNYRTGSFKPTNGTQFFITLAELRDFGSDKVNLDYKHTIFGQLVRGFDVLTQIGHVPRDANDAPNSPVKMTALSVAPSKTDGVLLISATAPGTSTITVTAKDPDGNAATHDITITVVPDTINDPPIIDAIDPVVMPLGGAPNFKVRTFDLESDAVSTRFPVLESSSGRVIYAGLNSDNLQATARPTIGAWDVTVSASGLNDPLSTLSPYSVSRFQVVEVGVGDRAIAATPQTIEATAATSTGTVRLATFRHGGVGAGADDFLATVIWGDGSNSQSSGGNSPPVTVLRSPANPSYYEVRAAHTYARPGVYPLQVVIDGPAGSSATAEGTAIVNAAGTTLHAAGANLEFNVAPLFFGRPVATFTDTTPGVRLRNFSAIIDWGDGLRAPGGIRQIGPGRFNVVGSHRYLDPTRYSVTVYVHRETPIPADAVAWSSIKMSGFPGPGQLPPFPKASITSYWSSDLVKTYRGNFVDLTGSLFIINGGQKPTTKWTMRLWLSNNETLETSGPSADKLLSFGPLSKLITEIPLNALSPGSGGNFGFQNNGANADFTIRLPAGETGAGKFVLAQLDYHDPITDNMSVKKAIPFGPLPGILVTSPSFGSNPVLTLKEGAAGTAQHSATFRVRLDTAPTAEVHVPLQIVNSAGTADTSRATLDHSELIFTPGSATIEQIVTVTVVDNTVKDNTAVFSIRLKPATSTDSRFNGMDATDITLQVLDND